MSHGKICQLDGDCGDGDSADEPENENENENDDDGINLIKDEFAVRLLLTNARSLRPKVDSLSTAFSSLGLSVACITETWYRGGKELKEHINDFEGETGIRILHRSRDGRARHSGGGVAVAFDTASCNLKTRCLKHMPRKFKVMCVTGVAGKISRKVVIFVVYVQPTLKAAELEEMREALAVEVDAVTKAFKDPLVLVTGDFNHREFGAALNEVGDFDVLGTGPTRGESTIDLVYTNAVNAHVDTRVLPPLESIRGTTSDHRCVYTEVKFPPERNYVWTTQLRRTRDERREKAFAEDMLNRDWGPLTCAENVDVMVGILEEAISELTDRHFPLVRVRKRSNESPWITKKIRRLWKRKIRLYKKAGKSPAWWETERVLQESIADARTGFVEKMLEEGNNGKSFYAATKKLSTAAATPQWSVRDLFPGLAPSAVCDEVLKFYGNISNMPAAPLPPASGVSGGLEEFTLEKTVELLRGSKSTESRVTGDPLPHLIRRYPDAFAVPVAAIYNGVNRWGRWPAAWKTEHLTVIPKVPNPGGLAECRNISCTSAFSKVLEGVVMLKLRDELVPYQGQYGGRPKCGAEHMLIEIWEKVMEALDGGKNAAILLGVDYEKAFNRMEHAICLERLRLLGASEGSVALVRAFLQDRSMTITICDHQAAPIKIVRGSPQGSVLGCLLYCVTTQLLTKDLRWQGGPVPGTPHQENKLQAFLYVDDTTLFDVVPMTEAVRHCTTNRTEERFLQPLIGGDFDELSTRAQDIGMSINAKKTQLLVISPRNGCNTAATFATRDGNTIESVDTMKLVGFTFGSSPGAGPHVEAIGEKYSMKKWMLYHLRNAGFKGEPLFKLYCCYIRSIFEYCSPVYHSLLTGGQEEHLERLQRHALRICFGHHQPVGELMAQHNVSSLKERRIRRCDSFIRKVAKNPRFGPRWLPPRGAPPVELRARRGIQEIQATTLRMFNSPISFLRRRANQIGVIPEAWVQ